MASSSYESRVAQASIEPKREGRAPLPKAIRALDAPPPRPVEWLIRDLWPAGEIGLLVGDGGAFKSTVALHLAAAIAGGYPVFDQYRTTQRPTLIISAEDPQDIVLMRLEALIAGHGWNRTRTLGNMHLMCEGDPTLGDARWRMHVSAEVERIKPGYIVLDPWAELLGGDENSNTDARPAIKFLRSLTRSVGAAVGVVHHAGKAGAERRLLDRIRGASALPSAARVIWFFDYQDAGVAVECLKMSRAPKPQAFVVKRAIQHEPSNRALWTNVKLGVEDAKQFALSRAESFVVEQLRLASTGRRTTAELRELVTAVGRGVSRFDLTRALSTLQARNVIGYIQGKQNARHWFLVESVSWIGPGAGQGNSTAPMAPESVSANETENLPVGSQNEPTEPTENLPGRFSDGGQSLPGPLKGPVGSDRDPQRPVGSTSAVGSAVSNLDPEEFLAEVDERLGQLEDEIPPEVED